VDCGVWWGFVVVVVRGFLWWFVDVSYVVLFEVSFVVLFSVLNCVIRRLSELHNLEYNLFNFMYSGL